MRLTPRRRKFALLLLSVPAVITAALWCASFIWQFLWAPPSTPAGQSARQRASLWAGSLHYTDGPREWAWRSANPTVEMEPIIGFVPQRQLPWHGILNFHSPVPLTSAQWQTYYRPGNLKFPLLPVAFALLLPPLTFYLLTRPRLPGLCPHCKYNRTGIPITTPCPECGKLPSQPQLPS